ncbi:MAG: terpene cyclase/mutase family protein [Verrucomicrobia bacterium]|nr:terpene cyclase/mutase family protein [Verrucomicrobiota bacterium]
MAPHRQHKGYPVISRRTVLRLFVTGAALPSARLFAQKKPASADPADRAIARGISYLITRQEKDGSFFDPEKGNPELHSTALTSLGVLAFAAAGHLPGDKTREGDTFKRALDFLLRPDRQDPDGYLGHTDNSNMYGHGIATLALTEMLGMGFDKTQDRLVRDRAKKAVDLILRSQRVRKRDPRHEGAWRYKPESADADLSLSVWQIMALRSGKNAGLDVPKEAIDRAVGYLKNSYSNDDDRRRGGSATEQGGFSYQPGQHPEFAMTGAGMLAMVVCGKHDSMEVRAAANWLMTHPPEPSNRWYYYGTYYYAQAMFQRGGEYAVEARRRVEDNLTQEQLDDGAWQGLQGQEYGTGKIYATSLAILSLAVKNHFLPIYQR